MTSLSQPPERGGLLRALRTTWLSAVGLCAMSLIIGQAVWRGVYLSRGYFTQDDFDLMRIGMERAMGPGLLLQNHSGHFWPVQWVVVWVTARSAGLDWFVAAASILGAQLVAGVLFWLILTRILPGSAWRLPLLGLFLFSPLSLGSTQWWAQSLAYLPSTVCLLAALLGALRWVQDGRRLGAWACVVFVAVGLLIQERAIFYPFVILAVLLLLDPTDGLVRRVRVVVRRRWVMLLGLAVVTLAFLVAHLVLALPTEARESYTAESVLRLMGNYVGRTLLPGLAGGPWSYRLVDGVVVVPAQLAVVAAAVLAAGLMVVDPVAHSWPGGRGLVAALVLRAAEHRGGDGGTSAVRHADRPASALRRRHRPRRRAVTRPRRPQHACGSRTRVAVPQAGSEPAGRALARDHRAGHLLRAHHDGDGPLGLQPR